MVRKGGGFKNVKLGKNVYRQMKRRGPPENVPRRKPAEFPQKSTPGK